MSTISEIVGWDTDKHRVIAKGIDGELYAGSPELVAEIANDPYVSGEPALYAKRACIHAMINQLTGIGGTSRSSPF